jgi:hypothetical protein
MPWLTKVPATTTTTTSTPTTSTTPPTTPLVKATLMASLLDNKNNNTTKANADPDCSDDKCVYLITNPTSPDGKQHCKELDNPAGTEGGYWKSKGWKYTTPPWTAGKCDRNLFNYVNTVDHDLDGFANVTFWYLGIQH